MDILSTKALYEGLPFPQRNIDDEHHRLITPPPDHLGKVNHFCFGGQNNFTNDFRALVAGGGTGDAVIYLSEQLAKRGNGRVTYLDQSLASMNIARQRAEARGLTNIDWKNGSILEIASLELGEFDYINCVGVIHHLDKPIEGLSALSSVLKESGTLCLMVYGRYGRQDITDARDLFRTYLKAAKPENILPDAKAILSSLSPFNSYMRGRDREYVLSNLFDDLPNLADIFLNPVEFTYSTEELAQLVEDEAGLRINRFTSYDGAPAIMSLQYNPALMVADESVRSNFNTLSLREQWKIAEILDGSMHLHCTYVSKQTVGPADFTDNTRVPFFPSEQHRQSAEILGSATDRRVNIRLSTGANFPLSISASTASFLARVNDQSTIQEILTDIQLVQEQVPTLLNELRLLADLEWICLRAKNIAPFLKLDNGKDVKASFAELGVLSYEHPVYHKP